MDHDARTRVLDSISEVFDWTEAQIAASKTGTPIDAMATIGGLVANIHILADIAMQLVALVSSVEE